MNYEQEHQPPPCPTEKSFGLTFAVVSLLVGLYAFWHGKNIAPWLAIAAAFAICGFFAPRILAPLNRLWFRFGLLLYKFVNPLVMGLMFFVIISPVGWIMQRCGKNLLDLRKPDVKTYWKTREDPDFREDFMKNQF